VTATERLGTYLNGHVAGANAGVATVERLAGRIRTEPAAGTVAQLVADITSDREQLQAIIDRLGVSGHPIKKVVGRIAGAVPRLAVAEVLTGSEHLTVLLEAETLAMGVDGKLALWEALMAVAPAHPQLGEFDLAGLAVRAREQRERVEEIRLAAARQSFAAAE
jgi:hypothetical protein